jgi:N utilization substance protein B
VNPENAAIIEAHIREQPEFEKCDEAHFKTLLYGCIDHAETLNQSLSTYIDRPLVELSPVEHASLLIGLFELKHCANIPYRVVINEAVELTKQFGGTDGHKYVNGVLDKAAVRIRPEETAMPSSSPSTVRRPRTPAAHPPLL